MIPTGPWLHCAACGVSWQGLGDCWSCGGEGRIGPQPRVQEYAEITACAHPICAELVAEARTAHCV